MALIMAQNAKTQNAATFATMIMALIAKSIVK